MRCASTSATSATAAASPNAARQPTPTASNSAAAGAIALIAMFDAPKMPIASPEAFGRRLIGDQRAGGVERDHERDAAQHLQRDHERAELR